MKNLPTDQEASDKAKEQLKEAYDKEAAEKDKEKPAVESKK